MNGAQSLISTLVANDVDVCFANPGTSEMHFVAALDRVPEMRAVLTLFEPGQVRLCDDLLLHSAEQQEVYAHVGDVMAWGEVAQQIS